MRRNPKFFFSVPIRTHPYLYFMKKTQALSEQTRSSLSDLGEGVLFLGGQMGLWGQ